MTLNCKNSILNIDYYNKNIEENYITIFSQYNKLIIEYLKHCYDTICIQNLEYKNLPTFTKIVYNERKPWLDDYLL